VPDRALKAAEAADDEEGPDIEMPQAVTDLVTQVRERGERERTCTLPVASAAASFVNLNPKP
jgi:hypothetical protein